MVCWARFAVAGATSNCNTWMCVFSVPRQNLVRQRQIDCSSCRQLRRVLRARNLAFVRAPTGHSRLHTHRVHHTGRRAVKRRQSQRHHPARHRRRQQKHRQVDQQLNGKKPTRNRWQTIYSTSQNEPKLGTFFNMPGHTSWLLLCYHRAVQKFYPACHMLCISSWSAPSVNWSVSIKFCKNLLYKVQLPNPLFSGGLPIGK